jgi:hypothetical protein
MQSHRARHRLSHPVPAALAGRQAPTPSVAWVDCARLIRGPRSTLGGFRFLGVKNSPGGAVFRNVCSREKRTCGFESGLRVLTLSGCGAAPGHPNVKTSYSRRGGRADRARNQSAIMRASRRMMNERESAPEGIFGNDRSPCQRRKFRAPESVAVRTQFNRNSCRGCALTTRPCDGPRTVAFSPWRLMKSGKHGGSGKTHRRYRLLARLWAVDDIH